MENFRLESSSFSNTLKRLYRYAAKNLTNLIKHLWQFHCLYNFLYTQSDRLRGNQPVVLCKRVVMKVFAKFTGGCFLLKLQIYEFEDPIKEFLVSSAQSLILSILVMILARHFGPSSQNSQPCFEYLRKHFPQHLKNFPTRVKTHIKPLMYNFYSFSFNLSIRIGLALGGTRTRVYRARDRLQKLPILKTNLSRGRKQGLKKLQKGPV